MHYYNESVKRVNASNRWDGGSKKTTGNMKNTHEKEMRVVMLRNFHAIEAGRTWLNNIIC